ncbi:phenylalanine--tRNA ligase subunit beta [Candidatus Parcubacteria bacterium]|nr:MAG: phenylalanine--tRNA ligase subunit beta [Candidatus Parcubacteria bacterium]
MTVHTVEIDGVEKQNEIYKNMVVGEILEVNKHPQADKLQLAVVDVKTEKLNIVCGAPNIEVGQKVPVALVGAVMPNGMEIKKTKIRGEESCGMMCAEDELGLGDDHAGIMILDEKAKIGTDLSDYLDLDDVIYEVDNKSITNRPDLWGHYGMAREIATFLDKKLKVDASEYDFSKIEVDKKERKIKIKIEDKEKCPRYSAVSMGGIKIEPSPKWLQTKLIASGIRPISNIVDVTNYVMLELAQPMHAFDASKISDTKDIKIVVRNAKKDEILKSLDGETRELDENDLVIASDKEAIAIAGVMGGEESEIDSSSTEIVLESANFNYLSVRKTGHKLALRSEASQRFEKSLDQSTCEQGLVRAVELIKKICPDAYVSSEVADESTFSYKTKVLDIEIEWINKILGAEIETKEIERILTSLGFGLEIKDNIMNVSIPSWRATKDVSIREDIAEEIARIYSYEKIEAKMPVLEMNIPLENESRDLDSKIRRILSGGPALSEVYNYSFVGEEQLKHLGVDFENYIRLANPISSTQTMLRQSLATNLFDNIKKNQARHEEIELFEIGSVYLNFDGQYKKQVEEVDVLPAQEKRLAIVIAGKNTEVFMRVKSVLSFLLDSFDLQAEYTERETAFAWANKIYSTEIRVAGKVLGFVNLLDEQKAKKIGLKKSVAVVEISLVDLLDVLNKQANKTYKQFDKFPPVVRDLAFVVSDKITYNDIKAKMENFHQYIKEVELFDVYQGEEVGKDKKSLAFHINYVAEKTLTGEEVDKIQTKLIKDLENNFEAKVRDF